MVAKVETWWKGTADANQEDFALTYPTGGAAVAVNITTECATATALAAAIKAAFNVVAGGAVFTVTVHATTGAYTITSGGLNFDLTCYNPIADFCNLSTLPQVNVASMVGSDYPESRFLSVAPLPEPDPFFKLTRTVNRTNGGRVESSLIDKHPIQPIALRFDSNTGTDLIALGLWLEYAATGVPFTLYRNSADVAAYQIVANPTNSDGTSVCVLTNESRALAREYLAEPATTQGAISFEARITSGY